MEMFRNMPVFCQLFFEKFMLPRSTLMRLHFTVLVPVCMHNATRHPASVGNPRSLPWPALSGAVAIVDGTTSFQTKRKTMYVCTHISIRIGFQVCERDYYSRRACCCWCRTNSHPPIREHSTHPAADSPLSHWGGFHDSRSEPFVSKVTRSLVAAQLRSIPSLFVTWWQ